MACSDYSELREFWANGKFFDGAFCYFANPLGAEFTQLMVFATLGLSLYAYSREPVVPLVLAIILGGVFLAPLPAAIVNTVTAVAIIVTAGVLYMLVERARQGVA